MVKCMICSKIASFNYNKELKAKYCASHRL